MPDAARPAADLLCPGPAARRLAGGLRQFARGTGTDVVRLGRGGGPL
jgi:hypothetical protein